MAKAKTKQLSNDERAAKLIELVNQKRAAIAQAEKPNYVTNMVFSMSEDGATDTFNLNIHTNPKTFVKILAHLRTKEAAFNAAAVELGIVDIPFTWQTYTTEQWKSDIVKRLNRVQISKLREDLKKIEDVLNDSISEEKRTQLKLDAIAAELGA